jgi:epoxyqueuosine reductase
MDSRSIKSFLYNLGFSPVGIAGAEPFVKEKVVIQDRLACGYITPGMVKDWQVRLHPEWSLPGVKSIISVAASYFTEYHGVNEGRFARYTWGTDYHRKLTQSLQVMEAWFKSIQPDIHTKICVDTGPILDRAVAARGGIGFIGKNCSLITPQAGSWVVLGSVMTDYELEPDVQSVVTCGDCRICLDHCPSGALVAPYTLNDRRCLSKITQDKGVIPRAWRNLLQERLWGCDTCQSVCPKNSQAFMHSSPIWKDDDFQDFPSAEEIIQMDEKHYQAIFRDTPIAWRGRTVLQRNAIVVLGCRQDEMTLPLLKQMACDPRSLIRLHAAWALGQFVQGSEILYQMSRGERDPRVIEEINISLGE